MRKEVLLEQVERVMTELGCPQRKIRKKLEELDLHHGVIKRAALREHLTEEGAEARASTQLGNPVALGEEAAAEVRQASWWGRHPILGFIVLPVVSLLPALIFSILMMYALALLRMSIPEWEEYFNGLGTGKTSIKEVRQLISLLFNVHFLVLTVLAIPFNWLARRSVSGLTWAAVPCIIFAAQGMFLQPRLGGRYFPLAYYFTSPHLVGGLGPLLIAVAGWYRHVRRVNRLNPLPEHLESQRTKTGLLDLLNKPLSEVRIPKPAGLAGAKVAGAEVNWFVKALKTPTYWVVALIPVVVVILIALFAGFNRYRVNNARANQQRIARNNRQNNANLAVDVWPGERETAIADVKARQANKVTHNETVINLQPYINVQLEESVDGKKDLKDNGLNELPRGEHVYGGVPFDVEGRIQLMGRGLEKWDRIFPATIKDIKVGRKCAKIHLLHGECCDMVAQFRGTIAKLILHYADDSNETIEINYGEHVLDWWGPVHTTNVREERRNITSPDAELAWVGSNPWIKRNQPDYALRLYKATFTNPHADKELTTVEYVSTMSQAAPFMLGLTVE